MIRTRPRFVTPSDFQNYTGKNLKSILKSDGVNNFDNLFLMRVEDRLLVAIDKMSFRTYSFDHLTEFQKENLQKAIIEQAEYILRNGDIYTDSGYDLEKIIATPGFLESIEICRITKSYLIASGLLNFNIQNRRRYTRF